MNPPHQITENGFTFELGTLHDNRVNYNFDRIKVYLNFKGKQLFGQHFNLDPADDKVLLMLCAYFLQDHQLCKKLEIDPKKGLLLSGPVGCGKTSLMKLFTFLSPKQPYLVVPARKIALDFPLEGFAVLEKYGNHKSYCLDDLGIEPITRYFGTECNTIAEVLLSRYDLFVETGLKTHATTNLNAKELEDRYGNRVRSRMRAMFNLIAFSASGNDKRK